MAINILTEILVVHFFIVSHCSHSPAAQTWKGVWLGRKCRENTRGKGQSRNQVPSQTSSFPASVKDRASLCKHQIKVQWWGVGSHLLWWFTLCHCCLIRQVEDNCDTKQKWRLFNQYTCKLGSITYIKTFQVHKICRQTSTLKFSWTQSTQIWRLHVQQELTSASAWTHQVLNLKNLEVLRIQF